MKILMVNKFLYPNGGSETYMFQLGKYLQEQGHEVQYFGMEHPNRCVGNRVNAYTTNMDFHNGSKLSKLTYSIRTIYSVEARKKIRLVLDDFKPDVVHLNNFNYQLTPSIIYEIKKSKIPIVQTVHDCQIACPNHRMYIEQSGTLCKKCIYKKNYIHCLTQKCVQNSFQKSAIAAMESFYYHMRNTYNMIDAYVCPSRFIANIIVKGGVNPKKIRVLCNPIENRGYAQPVTPGKHVLYFGRISREKGLMTLIEAARRLPDIPFIIAGSGPLEDTISTLDNMQFVGFKSHTELEPLIRNAAFSVYPSEWYENCPLSVLESQVLGIPVIGSDLGGTPELIEAGKTGLIFPAGNVSALISCIQQLWYNPEKLLQMGNSCMNRPYISVPQYIKILLDIYQGHYSQEDHA